MNCQSGDKITLFGVSYTLQLRNNLRANTVQQVGNEIILSCNPNFSPATRKKCLDCYLAKQLTLLMNNLLPKWQKAMNEYNVRFSLRTMNTRWGSCTPTKRTIRFSTLLASKPQEQIEYVIVHELAHLKEPNHSHAFWKIVEQYIPDYKELRYKLNHEHNNTNP